MYNIHMMYIYIYDMTYVYMTNIYINHEIITQK